MMSVDATTGGPWSVVVGVDACPAGWLAVRVDRAAGRWRAMTYVDLAGVLDANVDAAAIAIDIPIGLSAEGRRRCDGLARQRLGRRRAAVFSPPSRRLLALIADAGSYRIANQRARATLGHGISAQAFNIYPKIREADAALVPGDQTRVREVHPELSFALMAGQPCAFSKHDRAGLDERRARLGVTCAWLGSDLPRPPRGAAADDLLDAIAAAWSASRVAEGVALALPSEPELDPTGRRMEIVA